MPCGKIKTNVCVRCKAFALGVYRLISYICDAIIIVVMSLYVIYLPLENTCRNGRYTIWGILSPSLRNLTKTP